VRRLPERRLRLMLGLASAAFAVVIARAVQVQALDGPALAARGDLQQLRTVLLPARRGTIWDRNGRALAVEREAKMIVANPRLVRDPATTAAFIAQELGYRGRRARARAARVALRGLTRPGAVYSRVWRHVPPEAAAHILQAKLPGISIVDDPVRSYPFRSLASQLLGYTDVDGDGRRGAGLEYQLDGVLAGRPGREVVLRDPSGLTLGTESLREPRPGRDVRLTIDSAIQSELQSVLQRTWSRWSARSATGIVLDPATGEVLAMATAPQYDNNRVHDFADPAAHARNRAVQDTYEPGSTFKVLTMSAALSAHLIYPSMKFFHIPYEKRVGDKVIHDDSARGPVTLTVRQILQKSSNVGTVTIAQMAGKTLVSRWIDRFGFGRRTALHLFGEAAGIVLPPERWYDSSIGNIPIGQGISVTPVQMASMYAAIANGGVLVAPHVIAHVQGRRDARPARRRILSGHVAHQLVSMLRGVVSDEGTGAAARIPGYTVAGKTGTAQKADGHGGYSTTNYVASFIGFLPAERPRVEIMIVVDSPRGNIFGGTVAAPPFQEIGTWLTTYLGIRPSRRVAAG
jgi:cell division protein FtsI (penicillin-binding protein 3)